MSKSVKRITIAILSAIIAIMLTLGLCFSFSSNKVSAQNPTPVQGVDGAYFRTPKTGEENTFYGIRFEGWIDKTQYQTNGNDTVYGMQIVAEDLKDTESAWKDVYSEGSLNVTFEDEATKGAFYGSIVNIQQNNLTRPFTARTYYSVDGGTRQYGEWCEGKSIFSLASAALADVDGGWTNDQIAKCQEIVNYVTDDQTTGHYIENQFSATPLSGLKANDVITVSATVKGTTTVLAAYPKVSVEKVDGTPVNGALTQVTGTVDQYTLGAIENGSYRLVLTVGNIVKKLDMAVGAEVYSTPLEMFSADDGISIGATKTLAAAITEEFGSETVTAKQGETALTVETGNVIKGVTPVIVRDTTGYATGVNNVQIAVSGATKTVIYTVQAYSKVIDEFSDLDYFLLVSKEEANKEASGTGNIFYGAEQDKKNGYYILNNNIDGEGERLTDTQLYFDASSPKGTYSFNEETGLNVNEYWFTNNYGLNGTFDGNGYTISNFQMRRGGIFGMIGKKGIIKNLGVESILPYTTTRHSDNFNALFASHIVETAKLENLYINTDNISFDKPTGLLAKRLWNDVIMTNCVFTVPTDCNAAGSGIISSVLNSDQQNSVGREGWTNTFIISPIELCYNSSYTLDAGNISGATYSVAGVKRYDDKAEMTADAANNTSVLNTFDTDYWTIVDGIPCWKNSPYYPITIEMFSADDGYSMGSTTLANAIYERFGDNADITAKQGETTLTVESDYTIKGVTPDLVKDSDGYTVGVNNVVITVTDGELTVNYSVQAYTKVIDEFSDFAYFTLLSAFAYDKTVAEPITTGDNKTPQYFYLDEADRKNGYYILNNNIDCTSYEIADKTLPAHTTAFTSFGTEPDSGYTYNGSANVKDSQKYAKNYGLTGTFDGNGYTIKGAIFERGGLFGCIGQNATVKNLGIVVGDYVDGQYSSWSYVSVLAYNLVYNAKLENLYISANGIGNNKNANQLLANKIHADVTIKNCVFEVPTDISENSRGIVAAYSDTSIRVNDSLHWTNTFVISPIELIYHNKTSGSGVGVYVIDAPNKVTGTTENTWTQSGVKRYDDRAEMTNDATANTAMLATYDTAFWTVTDNIPVWKTLNA